MAQTPGAYETYEAEGIREDLSDVIYNIDPIETPFMSSVGRGSATQTTHEWQTDVLEQAGFNAVDEGNEGAFTEPDPTLKPNNTVQISEKTIAVSGTLEAVDKAGRKSELSYQLARKAKSLKRDMEFTETQNQTREIGLANGAEARQLASYENWIQDTDVLADQRFDTTDQATVGTPGAQCAETNGTPDVTAARTEGTQRPLLESMLKSVIRKVWNAGGDGTLIITGPFNKQVISGFAGNSTRFDRGEDKSLTAAIDYYVSDYGTHKIVADRFSRDRSVLVVTPELWSTDYLRPFKQQPLAKTGDAEKRLLNVEWTLRCSNRSGSGIIADLTTS